MRYILLLLLVFVSGCANHELKNLGTYQDSQDMNRMKYYQEIHDEKVRKDMKYEHRSDILFNLAVTKEQVAIDDRKFGMLDKYHIDGAEHISREEIEYYNKSLNKDRARLENEDGIARPDDVPETSPPNNPEQYNEQSSTRDDIQTPDTNNDGSQPEKVNEISNQEENIAKDPEKRNNITEQPIEEHYEVQHYTVPAN